MLDTGSDSTVVRAALVDRIAAVSAIEGGKFSTAAGTLSVSLMRVKVITLSTLVIPNVVLRNLKSTGGGEPPNLIGMNVLARFKILLDLGHSRLVLIPDPPYDKRLDRCIGTGVVLGRAGAKYTVLSVAVPSPASEASIS